MRVIKPKRVGERVGERVRNRVPKRVGVDERVVGAERVVEPVPCTLAVVEVARGALTVLIDVLIDVLIGVLIGHEGPALVPLGWWRWQAVGIRCGQRVGEHAQWGWW